MGLSNLSDEPDTELEESPEKPSVSYIYIYERGRDEIEDWPEEVKELMANAYEVVSDGGIVRETFKRSRQYQNLHHAMSEVVLGISEVLENEDFSRIMEFVGPDADAIVQYLQENEEIAKEVLEQANLPEQG